MSTALGEETLAYKEEPCPNCSCINTVTGNDLPGDRTALTVRDQERRSIFEH